MTAELPRAFPLDHGEVWRDPISGASVPKELIEHLKWRKQLLEEAEGSPSYQKCLNAMCGASCLFWINAFAWTYRVMEVVDGKQRPISGGSAIAPFITWPVQDGAVEHILDCIENGKDLCIDKSRDMGASWLVLLVLMWYFLYRPKSSFLVVSRKEDLVDKPGDPDALFWKLDRVLERLPWWIKPNIKRSSMHLENRHNGSVIDGESTQENVGRGGRRKAILFDEAAAIGMLQAAIMASADSTSCRIFNSTPAGPGAYSDVRFSGIDVVILGYWDHPEKGQGRELRFDPRVGRTVWWTPWYEYQWTHRKRSRRDMAQNVLIDHMTSGTMVFDSDVLSMQMAQTRPPTWRGRIEMDVDRVGDLDQAIRRGRLEDIELVADRDGPLSLWIDVEDEEGVVQRPRQDLTYCLGIDISLGQGASNSVISIGVGDTKRKIGEWADANTSPDDLARVACMLGLWLGGSKKRAFVSWEANGPGGIFTSRIKRIGYPWLDKHTETDRPTAKAQNKYGFTTTTLSKATILGELNGDMAGRQFLNPCEAAVKEAGRYVYYETGGGCGPAQLEQESADATATHGDRTMADAILNRAMKRCGRVKPAKPTYPYGSRGWRDQQAEQESEESDD